MIPKSIQDLIVFLIKMGRINIDGDKCEIKRISCVWQSLKPEEILDYFTEITLSNNSLSLLNDEQKVLYNHYVEAKGGGKL